MSQLIIYISGISLCALVGIFIQMFLKVVFGYSSPKISVWIGILERMVIFIVIVLSGNFNIVGWVLGAKSVARFARGKNESEVEVYFVGTLLSLLFGLSIAIAVRAMMENCLP